jgi:hypothetical protein
MRRLQAAASFPAAFLKNRGARIRTGDLCDPNAALYRTEPRPEGRTRISSLFPLLPVPATSSGRGGIRPPLPRSGEAKGSPRGWMKRIALSPPWVRIPLLPVPATSSGRGGIRTHAGFRPHDFQSCALSRSATRPNIPLRPSRKGPQTKERHRLRAAARRAVQAERRRGWDSTSAACCGEAVGNPRSRAMRLARSPPWVRLPLLPALTIQRRGWDSNPRVPKDNALAGRRFKPLSHPSRKLPR